MHYGSLPKKTSIKGQPHELSYITPQEAGVLRMLGGAGKNVNGVPAYYHTPGHNGGTTSKYSNLGGNSFGEGQDTITADTYFGSTNDNNNNQPKKQSEQTIMDLLIAHNAKARAEREAAAAAEAAKAAETLASGNVSPTSTVQMVNTAQGPQVLTSTNVGSGTENTYLDPEKYTAMTGYEPPSGVMITSSDNVSSPMLDATKPTDTTGVVEDLMLAKQDFEQLFDPSLGNLMGDYSPLSFLNQGARALGSGVQQSYFVPGVGGEPGVNVMAESAADAFNMVDMGRFDNIQSDDPLFNINPANVLSFDDFTAGLNAAGIVDPVTGNVDSGGQGNYGDDVSVPYDYYGAPFGLGYDDNGNLIEIPLGDGITIPGTDITITAPPTDDGGGGAPPSGGSFSKKRDVYGNPIRLTKGGASWWKMAANWMNPSERIDTYVTVDENDNYVTSDGRIVPKDLLETALLTPTDIKIKTGTEEYQVPYSGISNMPTDYNALYNDEINQEPLPVMPEQKFIPASKATFKP